MPDTRMNWELRAAASGANLSGVLFRGLSNQANAAIHAWHSWVVAKVFVPSVPDQGSILDLGCGYGRLARVIAECRPDLQLVGQDVATAYCRMFRADVGPCVSADAGALPYANSSFDAVMGITCLMYVERTDAALLMAELFRVLRPGGVVLLLDPGLELQRVIACARGWRRGSPTGGRGFGYAEYLKLIDGAGFVSIQQGGDPWLSGALLMPGIGRSVDARVGRWLQCMTLRDCRVGGYSRLALHRWVCAIRA